MRPETLNSLEAYVQRQEEKLAELKPQIVTPEDRETVRDIETHLRFIKEAINTSRRSNELLKRIGRTLKKSAVWALVIIAGLIVASVLVLVARSVWYS